MLNWYSFVKSQPNFLIFGWEDDILNIACKLISTILCDWHYLVVCQHNSWANFILRQHRKGTVLFLQGSVGAVDSIWIVLLGIYSGVSLSKIIKFGWDFTKLYQFNIKHGNVQFFGPHCSWTKEIQFKPGGAQIGIMAHELSPPPSLSIFTPVK